MTKSVSSIQNIVALVIILIIVQNACGQDVEPLRLGRFEKVSQTAWREKVYLLPQFQRGTIIYQTGFRLNQTLDLNYNIYHERMEFLGEDGDTLGIKADKQIKLIEVGSHLFYHDYKTGFYEILSAASVSLAMQTKLILVKAEGNCEGEIWSLELRGAQMDCDRFYVKYTSYFFIDLKDKILKANKPSVLKLFPENKSDIQAYLIENPVDFTKHEDVTRLTTYCYHLDEPGSTKHTTEVPEPNSVVKLDAGKAFPSGRNLYHFPAFEQARITWSNNSTDFLEKMNYNLFTGKMDVITPNADTIEFKDWADARILNLEGNVFYQDFGKGYLEIILQGPLALAVRNRFILVHDREVLEEAAMTDQANASSVSNGKTVVNYDRLYKLEKTYFFLTSKNGVFDANKISLFRLLPIHRQQIIDFMKMNSISFKKEEDLMSLITFCNHLLANR